MKTILGALAATTLFVSQPASADLYLNIVGIKGESTVKGYEGSIPVNSFQWSASLTGGASAPVWTLSDAHFTEILDSSFIYLFQTLSSGGTLGNATLYAAKTSSGQYAAYVLAPQINTSMWFSSNSNTPSEAMSLTLQALHQAMNNPNVDTSRIYVTGVSMGGFGTWDILRRDPKTFAAAVPMSGGGDPSTASAIKDTPIWAFHGSADNVVSVDTTRNMVQALKDAGGSPNYTEVAGGGHVIWPEMYQDVGNTLYSWLFSQRLGNGVDPTLVPVPVAASSSAVAQQPEVVAAVVSVPEPTSIGLLLLGGVTLLRRNRK